MKKRENENHKQIINLITKLSKGEKVDLQSTSIEIIDPSNPDLGYLSSRSAPLSSERGKMVNENQKIQLKPVEESPVVTSDGK